MNIRNCQNCGIPLDDIAMINDDDSSLESLCRFCLDQKAMNSTTEKRIF